MFKCICQKSFLYFQSSHSSHSSYLSQLLVDDQLEASSWGESSPNREEALVESKRAFVLEDLYEAVNESIIELSVGWLVHQPGSDDIEWRHSASHEETGGESGHELAGDSVFEAQLVLNDALASIITGHLGGVQDHSSHHVGLDSLVEAANTLAFINLVGEKAHTFCFSSLIGHHSSLEDIKWVSSKRSNTSGKSSSHELAKETSVWLACSSDVFHWLVKSKSEGGVGGLSHPGGSDTLVESRGSLFSGNSLDYITDTGVSSSLSSGLSGDLESGLNNIDRVDEGHGDDGGTTGAENVLDKVTGRSFFAWHLKC